MGPTTVSPVSEMPGALREKEVEIAIITTPASAAQGVADAVIEAGVGSILNFAPTTVTVPKGVALRQVDLGIELQILSFYHHQVGAEATARG